MEGLANLLGAVGCAVQEGGLLASWGSSRVWMWGWQGARSLACCGGPTPMLPSVALAPGRAQGYDWRSGGWGSGACLMPALGRLMGCAWPGAVGLPGPVTRLVHVSLLQTDELGLPTVAELLGGHVGVLLCWLLCLGGNQGSWLGSGMGDSSVWGEGVVSSSWMWGHRHLDRLSGNGRAELDDVSTWAIVSVAVMWCVC
ncbi:hypothetical protein ATANTOWER_025084, partial [Ataeniobius toweri]|nr:hypothetical protein [Ataeniobius toweri]